MDDHIDDHMDDHIDDHMDDHIDDHMDEHMDDYIAPTIFFFVVAGKEYQFSPLWTLIIIISSIFNQEKISHTIQICSDNSFYFRKKYDGNDHKMLQSRDRSCLFHSFQFNCPAGCKQICF